MMINSLPSTRRSEMNLTGAPEIYVKNRFRVNRWVTLEMKQYEVITALDGAETVTIAKKELPDIILLDVMMPVYDGFMVNEILKKDVRTKDIPVFVGLLQAADKFFLRKQ